MPPRSKSKVDSLSPEQEELLVTSEIEREVGIGVDQLAALFQLDTIKQFGPQKFKELHEARVDPAEVISNPSSLPLSGKRGDGFRATLRQQGLKDRELARQRAVRQIVRAHENQARILIYNSPEYPRNVLHSNNPVPVLYARGSVRVLLDAAAVACVGSRAITSPYSDRHRAFAAAAVADDFSVVSGFATGADRVGHEAAYEEGGRTVLVMPCGLDRPFPPENQELWNRLLSYPGAAMVSEFPFGTKAAALTLRKRNKLIVAFALGLLLSQSSADGGAMNAYRFALEQWKPVATFAASDNWETSGNAVVERGPPARRRKPPPSTSALLDPAMDQTTVFPADSDHPSEWHQWLKQLSFSI